MKTVLYSICLDKLSAFLGVNLNNPSEVRMIGMQALKDALGPVGMVRFMQQYDLGYGDYTREKKSEPDIDIDEIDVLLKQKRV